ncbi:MAG: GNAT family N-acetyltransferase [Burkholderiaceae bacterium]|nr:GNAT family N-acetyltransferase [Burkholderiaceae bacterium]MDO9089689.1 GNAT family N-acetyltransferase [Burkholderiaceae bacterium]
MESAAIRAFAPGELTAAQIDELARLHCECLPDSLFSRVGLGATRCLYRMMARSSSEVFVLATDANSLPVGASVSSTAPDSLLRRLITGSAMSLWLALRFYRLPWSRLRDHQPAPFAPRPELMFLFMRPDSRNEGAGARLVRATEQAMRARAEKTLYVMTEDRPDNRALAFYRELGYQAVAKVRKFGVGFVLFGRPLG